MFSLVVLLLASTALIDAKPSIPVKPSFSRMIVGGEDASPHEFPWQLSQQLLGASWSHWCGASLLGAQRVLSAAHCIDGEPTSTVRVIAGLHNRDDETGTQTANAASYAIHEDYNVGTATFPNDIAIINLVESISEEVGRVQYATLPADNSENFAGQDCIISGWGRTSNSNILPNTLQKATMGVITTAECDALVDGIGDAWDGHICVYDTQQQKGSCNADSGGPMNCGPAGSMVVAGVTSWGISTLAGNCLQEYPSVYTRTGYYLDWINSN